MEYMYRVRAFSLLISVLVGTYSLLAIESSPKANKEKVPSVLAETERRDIEKIFEKWTGVCAPQARFCFLSARQFTHRRHEKRSCGQTHV